MPTNEKEQVSELYPELLSSNSINPLVPWISASRLQMFSSHISQAVPVKGCTDQGVFSGMEPEFGKYTYAIKIPEDAEILQVIKRYPPTFGYNSIKENPEEIIIFQYQKYVPETDKYVQELDYISNTTHHSLHRSFGFRFKKLRGVQAGDMIAKDTILAASPSIDQETGNWRYGIEATMGLMTIPQSIEDGYTISESLAAKGTTLCVEEYEASWGSTKFPLNLFGDDKDYKFMPDIGECVGPDGVLMALRSFDENTAPVMLSRKALRKIDYQTDERIYVEPNSRVIDIKIVHDYRVDGHVRGRPASTPTGTMAQAERYLDASYTFWSAIRTFYERASKGRKPILSDRFNNLIYQSYIHTVGAKGNTHGFSPEYIKATRTWGGAPIDEWKVVVTLEYEHVMAVGSKLTGRSGNKGVVVNILPDEMMPMTEKGVRVDIIGDPISIIKRMNPSVPIEIGLNASSSEVCRKLSEMKEAGETYEVMRDYLLGFYKIASIDQYDIVSSGTEMQVRSHIDNVIKRWRDGFPPGTSLFLPTSTYRDVGKVFPELMKSYPPEYGPLTYVDLEGRRVTTKDNMIVGSAYIMILEKIGKTTAAVASAKLNHFGIPAKLTNSTKNLSPGRIQPIRFGESEIRLFIATIGSRATAEIIDKTNNPEVRKQIQRNVLASPTPTNEESLVDRRRFPTGNSRIIAMVNHFNSCAGRSFARIKRDPV